MCLCGCDCTLSLLCTFSVVRRGPWLSVSPFWVMISYCLFVIHFSTVLLFLFPIDAFVPVANVLPVSPDVAGAEVNLRLVRKEAYRSGPSADGEPSHSPSRPFPSESGQVDLYKETADLLPASTPVPHINFKPRHTNFRTTAARLPSSLAICGSAQPQLGAVASLAIDGGLSPDQLLHIGCSGSDHTDRYPPSAAAPALQPVDSESAVGLARGALSGTAYPRHIRSAYATHQPILLSRSGQSGVVCGPVVRGQSRAHIRIPVLSSSRGYYYHPHLHHPPFQMNTFTTTTAGARRGSFPLQMTRVGGLVLETPDGSHVPANTRAPPELGSSGACYQSLSACTSPTSVKHPSDSSSPRGTAFFSSSSVPSPANTPPLPPNSTTPATAPTSCVDIVRLGPGDTITHALSGDAHYTANSLIRMHYCPQPYVGLGPVDDGRVNPIPVCSTPPWFSSDSSGATGESAISVTTGSAAMAPSTHQVFSWSSFTPSQLQPCEKSESSLVEVV